MTKTYLRTYGDLYFEKTEDPVLSYTAAIDNYKIEDASVYIKISSDALDKQVTEKIDAILKQLGNMNDAARQAYLDDFNNEEESRYVINIYKQILNEAEFTLLMQLAGRKDQLLFAVNLTSIDINLTKESVSIIFTYIKGYELIHRYKFDQYGELKELVLPGGGCTKKEQLSALIDMRELPAINEICSRFRKDWQNYPVKSYFVYLIARRVKHYLKTV